MEPYKHWVRKNKDFVHSLESLANGVTWLLPERFSNSEILPEAVYAVLGVFSAVNQHIIDTTPTQWLPKALSQPSFPWPLLLSVIKDVETVIEVATEYYLGEAGKWDFLAATEGVKALVRFAALRDSGYKMLLHGGELVNEKGAQASRAHNSGTNTAGMPPRYMMNAHGQFVSGYLPRTLEGRAMSALNRFAENAKTVSDPMWSNRLQQNLEVPAVLVEKPTLSSILFEEGSSTRLLLIGEVLSILRPLIYVLLVRKFGIRSWVPWAVSLAIDVTSMSILSHATSLHKGGEEIYQLSAAEKHELRRRKMAWALYVIRDPFFTMYTRHHLEKTDKFLSPVPLIGFFTGKLVELLTGLQTRYTYTSAS